MPKNLVKCILLVQFYKRKLRLTGCSILIRKQILFSEGQVSTEGSCSVR